MHARSSIVIYRYISRKKLNAFSVVCYVLFFLIVVTVKVYLKLALQLCMIEGVRYVRNSSWTLIRKGTINSVTSQQNYTLRSTPAFAAPVCKTNRFRDSFIISHCI